MLLQIEHSTIVSVGFIPIIIALTAIAFPLLIQSISRIDEKYDSTNLVKIFYRDDKSKAYLLSLILAILSIPIWFFAKPRMWDFGMFNELIDSSSFLIIGLCTLFLIYNLFSIAYQIFIFYQPDKLLEFLISKYKRATDQKFKTNYFIAISDILYFSIRNPNDKIARRLVEFLAEVFIEARKEKTNEEIKYTPEIYECIFEANEQLCLRAKKTISFYNDSTLLDLLVDSYQRTSISEETYIVIWRCLRQAVERNRNDIVMSYWGTAHQHISMFLPKIFNQYNDEGQVINQDAIDKRDTERERFKEFHFVFGGLLLYLNKNVLLKEIMLYTNQEPPKYSLVPETLTEVIDRFMSMPEWFLNPLYYEQRYGFPEIYGIRKESIIRMWIKKYYALLFIRQYTLHNYHYGRTVLDVPEVPNSIRELRSWEDKLEVLKKHVSEILNNQSLLETIGYGHINENWFTENDKSRPTEIIEKLKEKAKLKYEQKKQEQPVSEEIENQFKRQSKKIIAGSLSIYDNVFSKKELDSYSNKLFINGTYQLMEKAGFAAEQDVSYLDADTYVAQTVAANIHFKLTGLFARLATQTYSLNREDIFPAIERMNVDLNKFQIISFGLHLPYFIDSLRIKDLEYNGTDFLFKGNKIICLDTRVNEVVRYSLFLVRKEELPVLKFNTISPDELEKYELVELDNETHLSASIIDLNIRKDLRDEISKTKDDTELKKNVLACIAISIEINWNTITSCIQLKPFDQFSERSKPMNLAEIKPIS